MSLDSAVVQPQTTAVSEMALRLIQFPARLAPRSRLVLELFGQR
jgi:hypothetical protein